MHRSIAYEFSSCMVWETQQDDTLYAIELVSECCCVSKLEQALSAKMSGILSKVDPTRHFLTEARVKRSRDSHQRWLIFESFTNSR